MEKDASIDRLSSLVPRDHNYDYRALSPTRCQLLVIRSKVILEFEWDEDKAVANLRDHGVAFHEAIRAVRDTFAVERIDDREDYGEERINLIGMSDGVLIQVTYTERNEHIRIISARRAERHEQDDYYRQNSP